MASQKCSPGQAGHPLPGGAASVVRRAESRTAWLKARKRQARHRGFLELLKERRARKLMGLGVGTPEDERRWARNAGLPVAELRRRANLAAPRSGDL
jgi:hypothetical protein